LNILLKGNARYFDEKNNRAGKTLAVIPLNLRKRPDLKKAGAILTLI
jgi:hypothetical protein